MPWIHAAETAVRTDPDGNEVEIPKGLPRRAPWMDDVLEANDYDPDEHLPIDWTENRKANVPEVLADEMAERYAIVESSEGDA